MFHCLKPDVSCFGKIVAQAPKLNIYSLVDAIVSQNIPHLLVLIGLGNNTRWVCFRWTVIPRFPTRFPGCQKYLNSSTYSAVMP